MSDVATPPFGPVLTAIITPFDASGAVDYGTFWRLCRHLVDSGSDGVVVAGTTGESPTLSVIEKVALFNAAVDAVGGRGAVVAGTGTYDTRESVELTEQATEVGCDGVMAVTPYYSRPPQEGIYRHMAAIAGATDLPMMVYNIPGRTARLIEIETLLRLAEVSNIVAVKDAVDDIEWSRKALAELGTDLAVYSGSDGMTAKLIEAGAVGVVSVAAHVVGPQVARLTKAALDGDRDEVDRLSTLLDPVFVGLFVEPSPMPVKAILSDIWDDVGDPRLPLVPASAETLDMLSAAVAAAQTL
jgi:4-hydroxy-tetrahydrodipicolinate synthase